MIVFHFYFIFYFLLPIYYLLWSEPWSGPLSGPWSSSWSSSWSGPWSGPGFVDKQLPLCGLKWNNPKVIFSVEGAPSPPNFTSPICSVMAMKDYILQAQPPASRPFIYFLSIWLMAKPLTPHQGAPVYSTAMWLPVEQRLFPGLPHWGRYICSLGRHPCMPN